MAVSDKPLSNTRFRGFTLLELLVVLVMIGIILSFAMLSIGDGGRDARLGQEARRMHALFSLAGEEAVLRSLELGVVLQQQGYAFVFFDGESWQAVQDDSLLSERSVPESMALALFIDGLPVELKELAYESDEEKGKGPVPQLLFFSSGERQPFELTVEYRDDPPLAYRIDAPLLGAMSVARVEETF